MKFINELTPQMLNHLHKIAQRCMSNENSNHTLQATALVNEAYLSLHQADIENNDRLHFYALAATHMRRILVDHARSKGAKKREALAIAITAKDELLIETGNVAALVLLDEVLSQFAELDDRAAKMYEMKLFAGMKNSELADLFSLSLATVERDIRIAKAWINQHFDE